MPAVKRERKNESCGDFPELSSSSELRRNNAREGQINDPIATSHSLRTVFAAPPGAAGMGTEIDYLEGSAATASVAAGSSGCRFDLRR
jgi:hypothetical protein